MGDQFQCDCCGATLDDPLAAPVGRVPWGARWTYAMRALRGKLRPIGPVDVSHLLSEGYMEGRVRIQVRG